MVLLTPSSAKKKSRKSSGLEKSITLTPKIKKEALKQKAGTSLTPLSQKKSKKTPKIKQNEWEVEVQESETAITPLKAVKKSPKKTPQKKVKIVAEDSSSTDDIDIGSDIQEKYKIKATNLKKAVDCIVKFTSENPKLKNQLFDNDEFPLFLQINSIKVPKMHSRILRIPLEHSLYTQDSEICLIVPDVKGIVNKEHEKHVEIYESLLRKKGVKNIKKIMTFHEFRTEYETFELKRKLVELYDVFLVDGRISGKVVKKAGKIFYNKRKIPISIKLQATKLKEHIDRTLKKTPLHLHEKGDSFMVQFGHSKMSVKNLVENVFSVIQGLDREFPGGFANLRTLNLKTFRGITVPIYTTLKSSNDVILPQEDHKKKSKKFESVTGELSTRLNAEVTVEPSGEVTLKTISDDDEEGETNKNKKRNLEDSAIIQDKSKKLKVNKRIQKKKSKKFESVTGESTTRLNAEVTVEPSGEVTLKTISDDGEEGETNKNKKRNLKDSTIIQDKSKKKLKVNKKVQKKKQK